MSHQYMNELQLSRLAKMSFATPPNRAACMAIASPKRRHSARDSSALAMPIPPVPPTPSASTTSAASLLQPSSVNNRKEPRKPLSRLTPLHQLPPLKRVPKLHQQRQVSHHLNTQKHKPLDRRLNWIPHCQNRTVNIRPLPLLKVINFFKRF
jgi:hypothetical protein